MIVIIGAMPEEVKELTALMQDVLEVEALGVKTWQGLLSGERVVVALSGVGKVNAAYTATSLLHTYKPTHVINIGSAGGLQACQKVGDVVVGTHYQYHDLDIGPQTHSDARFIFKADKQSIVLVQQVLDAMEVAYHMGLMVTGDQFITKEQPQFRVIQSSFPHAICVEMEAAAIAQVCARSQTPFVVLRGLSDIPMEDNNQITFEEYLKTAAIASAKICQAFIEKL